MQNEAQTRRKIIEQVEQTKEKTHTSLDEMNNQFNALMQRWVG